MYSGPLPCYCHFSFQGRRVVVGGGGERGGGVEKINGRKGRGGGGLGIRKRKIIIQ
jgi:hypothetical protein